VQSCRALKCSASRVGPLSLGILLAACSGDGGELATEPGPNESNAEGASTNEPAPSSAVPAPTTAEPQVPSEAPSPADTAIGTPSDNVPMEPSGGSAEPPTLDDVDFTLGGLNEDLSQPVDDCESYGIIGCISFRGEVNGTAIAGKCQDSGGISGVDFGNTADEPDRLQLVCSGANTLDPTQEFSLRLQVQDFLTPPTSVFSYDSAGEVPGLVYFDWDATGFATHDIAMPIVSATHDEQLRVSGLNYPAQPDGNQTLNGAFAVSWTPKQSCADCDLIRLWVRFHAYTYF
jgi:hypothetical protein